MKVVIVSRHKGTIDYLKKRYPNAEVVNHIDDPKKFKDSLIIGNLPLHMVSEVLKNRNRFVMVSLDIPRELRGKELNESELKEYIKLYEIKKLELEEFKL